MLVKNDKDQICQKWQQQKSVSICLECHENWLKILDLSLTLSQRSAILYVVVRFGGLPLRMYV